MFQQYASCQWGDHNNNSDVYSGLGRELEVSVYSHISNNFDTPMNITQSEMMPSTLLWRKQSKIFKNSRKQYYFQNAYNKYYELIKEFGQPTMCNNNAGGMAVWINHNNFPKEYRFIQRIDLIDEECYNPYPYPHIGFLYLYIKMDIPTNKLNNVLSISGDINYDMIKKLLCVRGMSMGYNLSLIWLVKKYTHGKISLYTIKDNNVLHKILSYKNLSNIANNHRILKSIKNGYSKHNR